MRSKIYENLEDIPPSNKEVEKIHPSINIFFQSTKKNQKELSKQKYNHITKKV